MTGFRVPLYLRGEVVASDWVTFGGRHGDTAFLAPDPHRHVERFGLPTPMDLADLHELKLAEIIDVLHELGAALDPDRNPHIQEAYRIGLETSGLPASLLAYNYRAIPLYFNRYVVEEIVDQAIGAEYLDGWVERQMLDGRTVRVRAFGARAVHVVAGNSPVLSALTVIRNAVTRSDAIIKTPSNDPLTAFAIARTLLDVAPDHPLTKHLCVAYWKGGDVDLEEQIYRPEKVEKIVAWGGLASVKHVTRFIQPGLELIALDPKRSASIIGPEAFADEETMRDVARRAASDIGSLNQEACASARVIYVLCGTDAEGVERLNRLGDMIYEALLELPSQISTKPLRFDPELRAHLDASRVNPEWYRVIGGTQNEGAIVVSQIDEPVDYSTRLAGRVANLVPVDDLDRVTGAVTAYTQTVGVYPESLKAELRDRLPLFGAQRLTSLGYACNVSFAIPQDALEPLRRMCKWIVDETCDPAHVVPNWDPARWSDDFSFDPDRAHPATGSNP